MPLILPNTIANAIPADGEKLDQNFDTIVAWANQDVITRDGSTAMTAPLLLPGVPTQPNQAATKAYVDGSVPVGVIWMFGGDTAPDQWMLCRGQAISRATYANLFAVFSTRFGVGDNVTTFNLPDYRGTYPVGNSAGSGIFASGVGERAGSAAATLPAHTHGGVDHLHTLDNYTAGQGNSHYHKALGQGDGSGGQLVKTSSAGYFFNVSSSGGFPEQIRMEAITSTDWASHDHSHHFGGTTGASDRALTTGNAGVDPTNGNLPPSMSINFIVKVL